MAYWSDPFAQGATATTSEPTWGDYWSTLTNIGGTAVLGAVPSITRHIAEKADGPFADLVSAGSQYLQGKLRDWSEDSFAELSPVAQERLAATLQDEAFYSDVPSSIGLKATAMFPSIAASVAAALFSGGAGIGGIAALAGTSGALSAGQTLDEMYQQVDSQSDDELQKNSTLYAGYRSMGMTEEDARKQLTDTMIGYKPIMLFALGAVTGVVGPEGQILRGIAGGAGRATGRLATRAARGVGVGGTSEFVQTGAEAYATEQSGVDAGLQGEVNYGTVALQAAEGGLLGGVFGGAADTFGGRRGERPGKTVSNTALTPDPAQIAAATASQPPPTPAAPPPPAPSQQVPTPPPPPIPPAVPVHVATASNNVAQQTAPVQPPPAPQPVVASAPVAPDPAVTPIVTPVAPAPAAPVPAPVTAASARLAPKPVTPKVTAPEPEATVVTKDGRRVLQDLSPTAKKVEEQRVVDAAKVFERIRDMEKAPAAPRAPRTNVTKEEAAAALELFNKHAPDKVTLPSTPEEVAALKNRLQLVLKEAKEAGIKIPTKVGYKGAPDHMVWLREVLDLATHMAKKSFVGPKAREHMISFLAREAAAKGGDFAVMRGERAAEGEARKRGSQKDVDTIAAPPTAATDEEAAAQETASATAEPEPEGAAAPEAEVVTAEGENQAKGLESKDLEGGSDDRIIGKDDVQTTVGGHRRGPVRDSNSESTPDNPHAGKGIKVEITDELRKKYETPGVVTPKVTEPSKPASNITPKVAAVKAKVDAKPKAVKAKIAEAAKQVDRKPTEAQKEAGNYEKGHVSIHGLPVTIENAAGSTRTGKNPDGTEWTAKLPAHRGYIKRTEGADGEQVDVYVGPNPESDLVVVIDQVDPDTRAFDEHKVMLGFKNVLAASQTYDAAFSDGSGAMRVGDLRVMTIEEFKKWLKKDTTQPAGVPDADKVLASDFTDEEMAGFMGMTPEEYQKNVAQEREYVAPGVQAIESSTVGEYLAAFTPDQFPDLPRLYPILRQKLLAAVSDVKVFVISDAAMNSIYASKISPGKGVFGLYRSGSNTILLNQRLLDHTRYATAYTLLHEAVHAATVRAIEKSVDAQIRIRHLMEIVQHADKSLYGAYGLLNEYEFIAEAMSRKEFQDKLAAIRLPHHAATFLGMANWRNATTWDGFIEIVRSVLGLGKSTVSALEAAVSLTERAMFDLLPDDGNLYMDRIQAERRRVAQNLYKKREGHALDLNDILPERFQRPAMQEQVGAPKLLKFRGLDQIAQVSKDFGKEFAKHVRKAVDGVERIRVTAEDNFHLAEPIVAKLFKLERKHRGKVWEDFVGLLHDETMAGVYADRDLVSQTHLGKDALHGVWPKAQHADLKASYDLLPADLKAIRLEAMKFFTDMQNKMSMGILHNRLLKALGIEDDALADRIFNNTITPQDIVLLGHDLELIQDAMELAKIKGPYFPLMRRGEFVVRGTYKVTPPSNALRQLEPNVFEFKTRKEAIAYTQKQDTKTTIKSVWVDPTTGERFFTDTNGKQVRVTPQDVAGENRFRVTVQDRHVEFFDTNNEARARADKLSKLSEFAKVEEVVPRRFEPGDRQADMLSHQMQQMVQGLEKRSGFRGMSKAQQNELIQALNEASIRFLSSTRIQSRRLPRSYVEGASKDLTKNTLEYAQSSSGYLARLEHQPGIDDALKAMRAAVSDGVDYAKGTSFGRGAIANEIERRITQSTAFEQGGKMAENIHRVSTLAFIRYLFSPAYSVVNALQPTMITYPTLAARYGSGRAAAMMFKVYNDVGGLGVAGQGLKHSYQKAVDPAAESMSFFEQVKGKLKNAKERQMLDQLRALGSLGLDAGLEISRLVQARSGTMGKVDTGLGYMSGVARVMPRAVETINRTVSALSAYRLEMERSGDYDKAVLHAQEVTNLTQGLYSHTDAPAIFNHPLGKLSLQFKKYGQLVYGLLGHNIGKVIRNAEAGDRAEGVKTLAMIGATHLIIAGTLGLPTEPIKYLIMGANIAGLTELTWADVENYERELMSQMFGKNLGEVITRGVTRAIPFGLGFDLSSRVGMQDLLAFGEPRSTETHDIWAYLGETVAGAPGNMMADWLSGSAALGNGDVVTAVEKLLPMKFATNSIKAYRLLTEGKQTAAGYQSLEPYNLGEAFLQSFGFTPERAAEASDRRSYFYGAQAAQTEQRAGLMQEWLSAGSASKRARLWGRVEAYNRGRPRDERLTRAELQEYVKRRGSENVQSGFRLTRRDKALFERTEQTYNAQ